LLGPHEDVYLHRLGFGKARDSAGDAVAPRCVDALRRHNQAEFRDVQIEPILELVHRDCSLIHERAIKELLGLGDRGELSIRHKGPSSLGNKQILLRDFTRPQHANNSAGAMHTLDRQDIGRSSSAPGSRSQNAQPKCASERWCSPPGRAHPLAYKRIAEAEGIEDKRRHSLIVGACNARASTIASRLQSGQHNSLSGQSNGVSTSS